MSLILLLEKGDTTIPTSTPQTAMYPYSILTGLLLDNNVFVLRGGRIFLRDEIKALFPIHIVEGIEAHLHVLVNESIIIEPHAVVEKAHHHVVAIEAIEVDLLIIVEKSATVHICRVVDEAHDCEVAMKKSAAPICGDRVRSLAVVAEDIQMMIPPDGVLEVHLRLIHRRGVVLVLILLFLDGVDRGGAHSNFLGPAGTLPSPAFVGLLGCGGPVFFELVSLRSEVGGGHRLHGRGGSGAGSCGH
ncbi:hypothetical protein F5X68DRAFT_249893, partial [Plectosphaerella plurivora]